MSNNHHPLGSKERPNERINRLKLSVIKKRCPFCGHDKALSSQTITKCSRCKK